MIQKTLSAQIPKYLRRFLPRELLSFPHEESKATCDNCAMSREHRGARAKVTYQKNLKCCTFDPWVPNFVVGAMLKDPSLSEIGRGALLGKIRDPECGLPIGVRASTSFQRRHLRKKENEFGNREDWLCPYYDRQQNQCGIWNYRGNVCISFFCQSDYLQTGIRFWEELGNHLHLIELALAEECLVQLDFSPRQMSELLSYIDPQTHAEKKSLPLVDSKTSRRLWNGYDDPLDFYHKCDAWVQSLGPKELRDLLGESGQVGLARLMQRLTLLQKRIEAKKESCRDFRK